PPATAAPPRPEQAPGPRRLLHSFVSEVVDDIGRTGRLGRRGTGRRSLGEAWWDALQSRYGVLDTQDVAPEAMRAFQEQYDDWLTAAHGGVGEIPAGETFRVCFRLEPPSPGADHTGSQLAAGSGPVGGKPKVASGTGVQRSGD